MWSVRSRRRLFSTEIRITSGRESTTDGLVRGVRDAELGRNDNLVAHGRERLAHHVLVVRLGPIGARANVALRRVKEGIAHLVGLTDDVHGSSSGIGSPLACVIPMQPIPSGLT